MNRPDFEDYRWKYRTQWPYDVGRYVTHMEKYCDKLEQEIDNLRRAQSLEAVLKLERALDKACKQLAYLGEYYLITEGEQYSNCVTEEDWKEYLTGGKDEKRN